jgi:ABC-2 type transport system ATP-binding protein
MSFTVGPGGIFGILGPTGAGKTTTVECIEGLRRADGGSVRVLGLEPGSDELRHGRGAQLQESELPEKPVRTSRRLPVSPGQTRCERLPCRGRCR